MPAYITYLIVFLGATRWFYVLPLQGQVVSSNRLTIMDEEIVKMIGTIFAFHLQSEHVLNGLNKSYA